MSTIFSVEKSSQTVEGKATAPASIAVAVGALHGVAMASLVKARLIITTGLFPKCYYCSSVVNDFWEVQSQAKHCY